jgi:oligoribonuclease NrnB/cAMP/cGMP phosphodiesterase (DHH superfamily)
MEMYFGDSQGGSLQELSIDDRVRIKVDLHRSGAGITWDFLTQRPRPPIIDYVEDRDLWNWQLPESREINAFLSTYPFDLATWDSIVDDWDFARYSTLGYGALRYLDSYARKASEHLFWATINGHRLPLVNLAYEGCSDVIDYIISRERVDLAGYFFYSKGQWNYGLRSRNGVDCEAIAKTYGGGGHEQASGFKVPTPIHELID